MSRPIHRALISVSDKSGLENFARQLADYGVELLSTGGTYRALEEAGITVTEVSEHTGFPEMMDGRVKTLHPTIHGGLLSVRDNVAHVAAMDEHKIAPIDLLVVNLYPFEATIAREGRDPGRVRGADRHRRPRDGALRREEPPLRRRRHGAGASTGACWMSSPPTRGG